MSCCLYWVILGERLSVRVLASAVDDRVVNSKRLRLPKHSQEILERQKRPEEHNPQATIKAKDLQTPQ